MNLQLNFRFYNTVHLYGLDADIHTRHFIHCNIATTGMYGLYFHCCFCKS